VVDAPPLVGSQREDANGLNTSHGFANTVDPFLLRETLCNKPCLVLDKLACLVFLQLEHPFESDRAVAIGHIC
jgi:hypothetical protein